VADVVSETGRFGANSRSDAKCLSPLETRLVESLAGGASVEEAATLLRKSARTVRRWKARPEIVAAVRARTTEAMALARATLASAAGRAARKLDKLMDQARPDSAKVTAAKSILENAERLVELDDLRADLQSLRQQLKGGGG
jgi:hypothetical protein